MLGTKARADVSIITRIPQTLTKDLLSARCGHEWALWDLRTARRAEGPLVTWVYCFIVRMTHSQGHPAQMGLQKPECELIRFVPGVSPQLLI